MKQFILDTNVLIFDPKSMFDFKDNMVVIPMVVVEELDSLKRRDGDVGRAARLALKSLDLLAQKGRLIDGVELDQGGILRIEMNHHNMKSMPEVFDRTKPDNKILSVVCELTKSNQDNTILVSKDLNLRVKASAMNLAAEDYEGSKVDIDEIYRGYTQIDVTQEEITEFYANAKLKLTDFRFYPNQFVLLKVPSTKQSALAKYCGESEMLLALFHRKLNPWGISARNLEQRFALEILMAEDIKLVTLIGKAGTGKTLLALACGLQKVVEEEAYKKLIVARPIIPMGKDIGYLPGTKGEKLQNWMQPITDNLDFLFTIESNMKGATQDYLFQKGLIEVEALTYIRGRSVPNSYIIIDEAQNLTPHEVKTIITRAGENTKIILTGDPYQIDNQYLDETSNGLSHTANKFKQERISAHIALLKGERSGLAEIASNIL